MGFASIYSANGASHGVSARERCQGFDMSQRCALRRHTGESIWLFRQTELTANALGYLSAPNKTAASFKVAAV
jgi:hypothetical protein